MGEEILGKEEICNRASPVWSSALVAFVSAAVASVAALMAWSSATTFVTNASDSTTDQ